jgi:hypothetical protein
MNYVTQLIAVLANIPVNNISDQDLAVTLRKAIHELKHEGLFSEDAYGKAWLKYNTFTDKNLAVVEQASIDAKDLEINKLEAHVKTLQHKINVYNQAEDDRFEEAEEAGKQNKIYFFNFIGGGWNTVLATTELEARKKAEDVYGELGLNMPINWDTFTVKSSEQYDEVIRTSNFW